MLPEHSQRLSRIIRTWNGGTRNYMGNGKIPLFPVWQGIHTGNRSKATCKYMSCHQGLRTTQWQLGTFDASGEEVGWL